MTAGAADGPPVGRGRRDGTGRLRLVRSLVPLRGLLLLAVRPQLWPAVARLAASMRPATAEYLRFRRQTLLGTGGRLDGEALVEYVAWCRMMRQSSATGRRAGYRLPVVGRRRPRRR